MGALKNRQHLTPQILDPKIQLGSFFLKIHKVINPPKLDFGVEDLGGLNVADFWVHPLHVSILVNLLLATIFGPWGPSYDLTKNYENAQCTSPKTTNGEFFDSGRRKSSRRVLGRCCTTLGW